MASSAKAVWVVLIETTGNQRYIFATNRRAENVGASQLIWEVGTLVLEAVASEVGQQLSASTPAQVRAALRDTERNPPIETAPIDRCAVEILVAASGKALLLTSDSRTARAIVAHVTRTALRRMPGLDVRGAVHGPITLGSDSMHAAIRRVHNDLAALRAELPGAELRFQRLPVVAPCATSGLPAAELDRSEPDAAEGERLRSVVSARKRDSRNAATARLVATLGRPDYDPDDAIRRLEGDVEWVGLIHADGNGIGQIFQSFDKAADAEAPAAYRRYLDELRDFSLTLDECAEEALRCAVGERTSDGGDFAILPLVLGGDDVTFLCDGRHAIRLAAAFLGAFANLTEHPVISAIARRRLGSVSLGACAGVAIVKPHFPFHLAYDLTKDLTASAKRVKTRAGPAATALDFHVLYDASGTDLETIRARYAVLGGSATARPYVVGTPPSTEDPWVQNRRWSGLAAAVAWLAADRKKDDRQVPSSVLHGLREAIFRGVAAADATLAQARQRHLGGGLTGLLAVMDAGRNVPSGLSLFRGDDDDCVTGLIDALDLVEFWL